MSKSLRRSYAHLPAEKPRHFVVIGTTSSNTCLPCATILRRFWPVVVKEQTQRRKDTPP